MASPLSGDDQAIVVDLTISEPLGEWAIGFPATVAALLRGIKWGDAIGSGATISYSFPNAGATWSADYSSLNALNEPDVFVALTADQATAVRSALGDWAAVADLAFQEIVTESATDVGLMRFGSTNAFNDGAVGWAYYPSSYSALGGEVWLYQPSVSGYSASDWLPGGRGYSVLLHEIGHALGLKHSFQSYIDAPVTLPGGQESQQYTVMSYTSHPHDLFRTVTSDGLGGYDLDFRHVQPDTPMIYDIMAIQHLYGANTDYHSGNDIYSFNPVVPFFRTIWDGGGTDTISVSDFQNGCVISLVPGTFSKVTILSDPLPPGFIFSGLPPPEPTYDGTDNLGIAFNCWIENAIGGAGNDALIGNLAGNVLTGGLGNDTIDGGLGPDWLQGDAGTDTLILTPDGIWSSAYVGFNEGSPTAVGTGQKVSLAGKNRFSDVVDGGSEADTLQLTDGNDAYFLHDAFSGFTAGVTLTTDVRGQASAARGLSIEQILAGGGSDLIDLTSANYSIGGVIVDGGAGDDMLWGNAGNDSLLGGDGNDTLFGGAGNDFLTGGTGADVFQFVQNSGGADWISDFDTARDNLRLYGASSLSELTSQVSGSDLVLTWNGQNITLLGVTDAPSAGWVVLG